MVMRKLKSFLLLLPCLGLIGCGKEVEEVKKATIERAQELDSETFSIHYRHVALNSFHQSIPRNANFRILDKFSFASETPLNEPIEIYYNVVPEPFSYEFKCIYVPNNSTQYFEFTKCSNSVGSSLGNVMGIDFMLDHGKKVVIQSKEIHSFEAHLPHQVEWK